MRKPARSVSELPSVFCVGGVQEIVALPVEACATVIVNAGSDALALPSLTEMTTFEYVPAWAAVGVPVSRPVLVLNDAHAGLFAIEYVSVSLSGSAPVGWNV